MASAAGGDRDASCTNDPNFAVICVFLEKFGQLCGVEYPSFLNLQNFIENTDEVPPELLDLLVKLLRKNRYTVHPELWERALVKFCHTYSNQDAWEVERFGYKKSRLPVKLNILKSLLESQFDRNCKLKTAVGTMKAGELRSHPIGRDKFGNTYWGTTDNKACCIRIYQEHLDEETWQTVASNRDEFVKLIQGLKSDKPVVGSLNICNEDSSSNSVNNDKAAENSSDKCVENKDTSKVEVVEKSNVGEKENIILKITKNRIEESDNDEEIEDEEEEEDEDDEEDEEELSKDEVATVVKNETKSELQLQLRPSLLASKPPSKKPLAHPKKRANEIETETEPKKPKERLTLLGQQHKDKNKKKEAENDNIDDEEVEEEEEYSDEEDLEEEEVEEEEDEEEEGFEGEEDPEVSEPIEDPVVKVSGEGSGADNKESFLDFISGENCEGDEFSEVIEEDVRFFYGEGSGNACQVGNSKLDLSENVSKPDLTDKTECLIPELSASSKVQVAEVKKQPSLSESGASKEAESQQNSINPISSENLDKCTSKDEETKPTETNDELNTIIEKTKTAEERLNKITESEEIDTTNVTPLDENISENSSDNKLACVVDKVKSDPIIDKNQPPERDKMATNPKNQDISLDDEVDIKNNIVVSQVDVTKPIVDTNVSTMASATDETDFKTQTASILEINEPKISNGAKSVNDEQKNIESTSSASIVEVSSHHSEVKELTATDDKLTLPDKIITVTDSENNPIEMPEIKDVMPNIEKTKKEMVTVPLNSIVTKISESTEDKSVISIVKIVEVPKEEVEKMEPDPDKSIVLVEKAKIIVEEPEKIEIVNVVKPTDIETLPIAKTLIDLAFKKKPTQILTTDDSPSEKLGNLVTIPIEDLEGESKNVNDIPSKQDFLITEEPEKCISTTLEDTKLTIVQDEAKVDTSSKLNEPPAEPGEVIEDCSQGTVSIQEKVVETLPKIPQHEIAITPKSKESINDELEIVNDSSGTTKEDISKVIVKSTNPIETLGAESNKITTIPNDGKLEDGKLENAKTGISSLEADKSFLQTSQKPTSKIVRKPEVSKIEVDILINSEKSILKCKLEESEPLNNIDIPVCKKKEESIPSTKIANKTSEIPINNLPVTEHIAVASATIVELNGIAISESTSKEVLTKKPLKKPTEPKSNDHKNSVPTPNSKPTNSQDLKSAKKVEKCVKVDEVPEPQTISSGKDNNIPEINITEVEQMSDNEPETGSKIEPNPPLKPPEIDANDCTAKLISDPKDKSDKPNIQSFSLDFTEDDGESDKSDSPPIPVKRGRKPKPARVNKQKTPKDLLDIDDTEKESKSGRGKKISAVRKKKSDIESGVVTKDDENETPVRQSRRIAQLKIREEAERRKLEEMVLKQMKEDSDRKKKEEQKKKNPNGVESDPDAEVELEEEEEEDESNSESEKKIIKKPKKKKKKDGSQPWQTSSGSSDTEENDEELDILEHEEDEGLPPLKSDHEFSPESDMEDEAQAVPMKRARTVKKDERKETEEEEDATDENPEHACQKCGKHDHPEWILLCDICDKGYHCSCLTPVLFIIPEGDWYCPPCQHEKLINILSLHLDEYDAMIKQKEVEETRKRRMLYASVNVHNVLPISKKEPRARGRKKNRNQVRVPRRRKRSSDDDDDDDDDGDDDDNDKHRHRQKRRKSFSSSSSSSSSSGDTDDNSSDDEPIYKLRKRRQTAVSYRFNEFDDLINSAIKDEMDEVQGAGNLGRGKDISTIIEADKEEKRLMEHDINDTEVKTEKAVSDDKNITVKPETEDMDLEEPESKKILNDEDLLKEEDEKENTGAETDTSDIVRRPTIIKRSNNANYKAKKKSRKLNSLDIESDDDGSDEDFKGSSSDSEDEEEVSVSSASESSLDNKWSKKRKKNKSGGHRLRQRRRRGDRAFINDNSEDSDEIKRPVRKKKKKEESDFSDFDDDDDEEEDVDSEDLCDSSTVSDSNSDGAWKPKNKRRKKSSTRKQKAIHKRPAIMINRKKTKKIDDDEKSFKVGMTKKKVMAKPDSDDSDDENKARKTRGRKITYLEDFDESSDDGIRPGVKRPDTPPEERALFIQKQEEIKRMLAAKNTDAAKVMATPVLKPLKSSIGEPLITDSISTVPKQIIQNAKVLDPDFLKNKQTNEFDDEFDDQLPEDFDPEDMDEEEIAKMMEEEDFAQQQLKLAGEAIRNKKLKEAELIRKRELEKLKLSNQAEKSIADTIISPVNIPTGSIGPTPLTQLQTIQPPMMPQTRPMHHPPSSILSHGNPLPHGMHPSHMGPGPSPMPNMMMPTMIDTMRLLRPEVDMKKRSRKSILDLGLPRPAGYQATHIPSQMPPQLQQQMMPRPPVGHFPPMAHLPPSAHMPPGPQGPRAFQMQRHLVPHVMNQILPAHSMHSNPVRMAPPNVTVLPPNRPPPNLIQNPIANEPIIPTTVLSVANQKSSELLKSNSSSSRNSSNPPASAPNIPNPTPVTQSSVDALNAASQSELDALKRRGRRKKITPLRDPSKPNPGLADLSQVHAVPVPKTVEQNVQLEKKSNPILAERLTSSPAGSGPDSPVKSVLVASTQKFPSRASAATSVITRLQHPPRPHQTAPFPQGPSRYFAPALLRPPHPARTPFSGTPPPVMPPVTEPGPHYLTSDSRQPGGGHMFRPSLLHGFTGPSNPIHPLQIPVTQPHLVRGPTPPRDYSGGPTHPPPSFSSQTSQYGDFYSTSNQAVSTIPTERHQPPSPEHPPPFDQYEPLKSIPVPVPEIASQFETTNDDDTGGDVNQDSGEHGDCTGADGNSNSGPTSEFSGLVSYFSSQQDDLDT